jgi:glycosyltransferase involved in cell wall biosynthesis
MNKPLISVITVVYNDIKSIENTMLSVFNQTYPNIEYIIIDGGSTDGTVAVVKKYQDKLAYWASEPDKGIYDAMNKGISFAKGSWVNFMNSGDWFYSNDTIERIFSDRNLDDCEVIYGNTEKRNLKTTQIHIPGGAKNFWKRLMIHQSTFSRLELNKKYLFDTGLKVSADFDFIYKVFFYKHRTLHLDVIVSSFDLIGFSHDNRYIGFSEDRKIALKYKGNLKLSMQVYSFYVYITVIGKVIDVLKKNTPLLYKKLKEIKG